MTSVQQPQDTWPQEDNNLLNDNNEDGDESTAPVRKRTRATADQLSVLEDTFAVNVSPNSKLRKQLAEQLQMSERSIQIWFQNRRAKVKHMQKRAQMQMHQASIRAQLYQYHQQQQQSQPSPASILPQQTPQQHPHYYYNRLQLQQSNRSQSVDMYSSPTYSVTPPPMSFPQYYNHHHGYHQSSVPPSSYGIIQQQQQQQQQQQHQYMRSSMPPPQMYSDVLEFPPEEEESSNIPTLISVPDAGPTAILSTVNKSPSLPATTKTSSTSPTIDPSALLIHSQSSSSKSEEASEPKEPVEEEEEEPKDLYLSATTLTIGTWHRLKMNETDLVCVYRPDTKIFAWHIVDGGCHFKMEVNQSAVSSIEYILDQHDALADVHFDISEPPLFYMESTTTTTKTVQKETITTTSPVWVQCSDFTEGKQASRFFRHSLKGIAPHMKQELLTLIQNHEETKRLVQFIENPIMMHHPIISSSHYPPPPPPPSHHHYQAPYMMQAAQPMPPPQEDFMYWNQPSTDLPCELYMN